MTPIELRARRVWLSWLTVLLASAAIALVVAYLQPARNSTWLNLAIASIVLLAPLIARPPWTRLRLIICAVVWASIGLPGGFVFGVPVFFAGLILAGGTVADVLIPRVRDAARSAAR